MSCKKSAFILGGCSPVGRQLIEVLNQSSEYNSVVLLGRRAVDNLPVTSKIEQRIINYDKLDESVDCFENIEVGFCVIGTAGASGDEDSHMPNGERLVQAARIAREQGTKEFIFVSQDGLSQVLEEELASMDFQKLLVVRPGKTDKSNDIAKAMVVGSLSSNLSGIVDWDSVVIAEKALEFSV